MTSYYNNRQNLMKRNNTNNTDGDTSSIHGSSIGGGNATHGTDDLTAGDESSILLRGGGGGGGRPTIGTSTNTNTNHHLGIQKKNSEASGYNFGNSSVGGSSSVIRHEISYNPTVNTNTMLYSNNSMSGRGVGNGGTLKQPPIDHMMMLNWQNFCGLCSVYDLKSETLEYNYVIEAAANAKVSDPLERRQSQPYPRIRSRGEYYIDTYNDEPYSWTMGTHEQVSFCKFDVTLLTFCHVNL
jgi:hypothetical protein